MELLNTYKAKVPNFWSNATPPQVIPIILQDPVDSTIRVELERLPVKRLPRSALPPPYTQRTDPLDDLIDSLEEEHIELVRREGKDSPPARHAQGATDAAYAYRSGLVYIRPPAAFLKSSCPVTSLQGCLRSGAGDRRQGGVDKASAASIKAAKDAAVNNNETTNTENRKAVEEVDRRRATCPQAH